MLIYVDLLGDTLREGASSRLGQNYIGHGDSAKFFSYSVGNFMRQSITPLTTNLYDPATPIQYQVLRAYRPLATKLKYTQDLSIEGPVLMSIRPMLNTDVIQ